MSGGITLMENIWDSRSPVEEEGEEDKNVVISGLPCSITWSRKSKTIHTDRALDFSEETNNELKKMRCACNIKY